MNSKKNKQVVYVNEGARPSRFLVDLLRANEPKPVLKKSGWEKFLLFFKKEEKKAQIKRLAFFPLFKFLFVFILKTIKGMYKICFWSGWAFLFVIRFFGISLSRIFKLFLFIFSFKNSKKPLENKEAVFEKNKEPVVLSESKLEKKSFFSILKKKENQDEVKEKKEWKKIKPFQIFPTPLRPLVNFILILIAIALPLKAFTAFKSISDLKLRIIGSTNAAIGDIKSASHLAASKDFAEAGKNFSLASQNFLDAKKEISDLSVLLNIVGAVIPNNEIKLAKNADLILEAGRLSSEIGLDLSTALSVFNQDKASLEQILNSLNEKSDNLILNSSLLSDVIKKIDATALPSEYQETFLTLQGKADLANTSIKEFFEIMKLARVFFGFEQDKRYLFVFQNNAELRASGGFIGSFAVVDFRNGEIVKMHVPGGGSYDTEGGLKERIIAPEPLSLVNPLWHFWDANWWPDWPTSADKLAWFYEKSGGSTVDGVISFTPTVLERLLKIIGPLDMTEKYGVTINAENFWQIVQVISEQKPEDHPDYDKYARLRDDIFKDPNAVNKTEIISSDIIPVVSGGVATSGIDMEKIETGTVNDLKEERHEPKLIIGDMFEKIQSELKNKMNKENFFSLAELTLNSLNEKHIMFYFNDEDLQTKAESYSWTGKMKNSAWDYLMIVNTNIAGAKTDRVISEEISHNTEVADDGTITDTVEIIRRHNGIKGDTLTGVRNVDWLRAYVPEGSRLLSASGFRVPDEKYFEKPDETWREDEYLAANEGRATTDKNSGTKIYNEAGKTVFANWCMVDPGETIVVRFKYALPYKMLAPERLDDLKTKFTELMNPDQKTLLPYALMTQKQPGTLGSKFTSNLILPEKYKVVWKYGGVSDNLGYSGDLAVDRYWAVLAEVR